MAMEVWTDKNGKEVSIVPFLSKLYVDEEMERLSREFMIVKCDGKQRVSSLGKAELEFIAAKILVLARARGDDHLKLVGVQKKEFGEILRESGDDWYLEEMIEEGFLREKVVAGKAVLFPTEKLLKNQKIPRLMIPMR